MNALHASPHAPPRPAAPLPVPALARAGGAARPFAGAPETLHPSLWLGHQLGRSAADTVPTGFAALDAELPGGGWPRRALSELLLAHPGVGEIRLVAPPLVAAQRSGRLVMAFDPPAALSAEALVGLGIDIAQLLVVRSVPAGDRPGLSGSLWAMEQALKSGHVGAVLGWLPLRMTGERLRRLQLAAHGHDGIAFVFRDTAAATRPTPAPLRLGLQPGGADRLRVTVLKRRGPPLEAPLVLALAPVLSPAAERRSPRSASAAALASASTAALRGATFVDLG